MRVLSKVFETQPEKIEYYHKDLFALLTQMKNNPNDVETDFSSNDNTMRYKNITMSGFTVNSMQEVVITAENVSTNESITVKVSGKPAVGFRDLLNRLKRDRHDNVDEKAWEMVGKLLKESIDNGELPEVE